MWVGSIFSFENGFEERKEAVKALELKTNEVDSVYLQKGWSWELTLVMILIKKNERKKWGFDLILLQKKNSLSYVVIFDEEVVRFPRFHASYTYI